MGAELKRFFKNLAVFGGLLLCFRYVADFSSTQSVLLAIVASAGYRLYEGVDADRHAKQYFVPYQVSVCPNWYELLRDYRLISDDDTSRETYKKLSLGIKFSVLQRSRQNDLPETGLIYWNDHKTFVTDVDFSIPIPGVSCNEVWPPEVYFRAGLQQELGLRVPTNWWKQMCASGELKELAKTEAQLDYDHTGRTQLVIATLPYSEFVGYYHEPDIKNLKRLAKQRELIDRQLMQNGWKREEFDEIASPACIKHKYFTVWRDAI